MSVLIVFTAIVFAGDLVAVGVGEVLDRFLPQISLPIFLALFFAVFYFGWHLALRLTDPARAARRRTT